MSEYFKDKFRKNPHVFNILLHIIDVNKIIKWILWEDIYMKFGQADNFVNEKKVWKEFFIIFYDEPEEVAENRFQKKFASKEMLDNMEQLLHEENVECFAQLMKSGFDPDWMCKVMPDAEKYKTEGIALYDDKYSRTDKLLVFADDHNFSPSKTHVYSLLVRKDMPVDQVKEAITKASDEYCNSEIGKQTLKELKEKGKEFTYEQFKTFVPNEICKRYGIEIVSNNINVDLAYCRKGPLWIDYHESVLSNEIPCKEHKTQSVVVTPVDRDGLDFTLHNISLNVKEGMSLKDVKEAISKASVEFCQTEEGRKVFSNNNNSFNYGDFDIYVPNEICKKYGIEKVDFICSFMETDFNEELVDEADLQNENDELYLE